jgi:hypothetical protein
MFFEDSKVHQDSNSQSGSPLGNVWTRSLTLSRTFKNVNVTPGLHSQPAPFHAMSLVMNPNPLFF